MRAHNGIESGSGGKLGSPTSARVRDHGLWVKLPMDLSSTGPCSKPSTRHVFMDLLTLAEAHPRRSYLKGEPVNLTSGQVHTTLSQLSEHTGYTCAVLRAALRQLEEINMINMRTTNRYTVITICEWSTYQGLYSHENNQVSESLASKNRSPAQARSAKGKTDRYLPIPKSKDIEIIREEKECCAIPSDDGDEKNAQSCRKAVVEASSIIEWFDCLKKVGLKYDQPVRSKVWQDPWMKELPEIRTDILQQSAENGHPALVVFEYLLRDFFTDRDRKQRKATFASYFKLDWIQYWPAVQKKLIREKETRFYEDVEEVQQELKRQNMGYSTDSLREAAIKSVRSRNQRNSVGESREATA